MSNDVKQDLPESVTTLAKAIQKELKIGDNGVAELPKDIYEKHLPENLTAATIKAVQSHNSDFLAALTLATGEAGYAFLKKKKDVNDVKVEIKAGKDSMGVVYSREKTVTVPGNPTTQKTKYGQAKALYEAHAAGANRGALKKVREYLTAQAEAAAAS